MIFGFRGRRKLLKERALLKLPPSTRLIQKVVNAHAGAIEDTELNLLLLKQMKSRLITTQDCYDTLEHIERLRVRK